jgi:hypothetical protein
LVDVLEFIDRIHDPEPARTIAWVFSKIERSSSYRRSCEIEEWDVLNRPGEDEVSDDTINIQYVLSAW